MNTNTKGSVNDLILATNENNLPLFRKLLTSLVSNPNDILAKEAIQGAADIAATNGYVDIMDEILIADGKSWKFVNKGILDSAVTTRNWEIIQLFINRGFLNNGEILSLAAAIGNLDVIENILEREMDVADLNEALVDAAKNGNFSVFELLEAQGANDYNKAFQEAARNSRINITIYIIDNVEPNVIGEALIEAVNTGNYEMVNLLFEYSDLIPDNYLEYAVNMGY